MNEDPKTSDTKLVKLTLKNPECFTPLVERYEQKLFRYIRRLSGLSKECAEDVLQEVFIKIYRNLNNFDTSLKFSSWAYRIAHNETVNYLRKHRGKEPVSIETDDPDTLSLIDILESNTNIADEAAKKELQEKVRTTLKQLPKKYQEVLVLRFLEDMNYKEISDVLKKPEGTIAALLNRAKTKFKQLAIEHNLKP